MFAKVVIIGMGGFVGANARYFVGGWVHARMGAGFPYGTIIINVSGSFVLGLFMELSQKLLWNEAWRLLVAIGLLGAFTTFSTFSYETLQLIAEGRRYGLAALNAASSFALGLCACYLGLVLGRMLTHFKA
jgi:CrcB protein